MLKFDTDYLFKSEKITRGINHKVVNVFLNQLEKEDLSAEEREFIANQARKVLDSNDQKEEENSKFWYEYGMGAGVAIGVIGTVGFSVILSVIKSVVNSKH